MKGLIINILNKFGYRITKAPIILNGLKVEHDFVSKHQWFLKYKFETILDIGANKGQFAARFRVLFQEAWIYSFEPIPEVYELLCKRFEGDKKFKAFNLGLGKQSETIQFYQNDFSDSSSVLPMKSLHKENFPQTLNEKLIEIKIDRLDSIAKSITISDFLLVKIDVQGFEEMVILGGEETIKKAKVLIVEVSFYELYENQIYFKTIFNHMNRLGFTYHGNYEQLVSPINGCILQADAIFVNENS